MSELDRVRDTLRDVEARLERSDWDGLAALEAAEQVSGDHGDDAESLTEVLREVERLQHRIEIAMGAIREELAEIPQQRKAARAYVSAP